MTQQRKTSIFSVVVGVVAVLLIGACASQSTKVPPEQAQGAVNLMSDIALELNKELQADLFLNVRLVTSEAQLVIQVSDLWYTALPDYLRARVMDDWIARWTNAASGYGWTGLARIQVVDAAGKQVAYKSRAIP